jgi:hypothetical protein
MSAYPGEKVDACLGNRNLGEPVNRFAIGDLGFQTHCLSRVRRESHARFYGGRELATASGYPTSYVVWESEAGDCFRRPGDGRGDSPSYPIS